ncbi:MAG TPA: tripartite tricarboxylate transporter substrate binding protein [Methylibium sp.]|nr:tripartite tricarboxylate transporter substrate binding protein [Methylibium sp.]
MNVEWILSGLRASVCGLLIAAYGMPALAEAPFPSRPVTTLVPYPAGGAVDAFVRTLAEALRVEWKTGIVVDNRPGANEIIASAALAKARPDGYTLMASTEAATILNPLLFKKLPYDVKEIAPISILVRAPLVLAVPVNSTTNTLKEFIALARARAADPVRYGSAGTGGTGGTGHLPFIQFARDHGLQLIHVPYRGGGPLLQDLLGGQVEAGLLESLDPFGFVAVGSDAAAYAEHTRNEAAAQRKRIESAGIRLDL